jgi:hypothetical protein
VGTELDRLDRAAWYPQPHQRMRAALGPSPIACVRARFAPVAALDRVAVRPSKLVQERSVSKPLRLYVRGLCRSAREVESVHESITARDEPRIEQVLARGVGEATFEFVPIVTCTSTVTMRSLRRMQSCSVWTRLKCRAVCARISRL